ncbi:MAG TPA: DNA polymerase II [Ignavibacteriaceae bacterium]|nr:DNA polymerase II [Ignavibacteriaceae bacterium]
MDQLKAFILTGEWQDIKGRNVLKFIGISEESSPVEIIITNVKPVFFIERKAVEPGLSVPFTRRSVELKNFQGKDVDAIYFNSERDLRTAAEEFGKSNTKTYEADIDPVRRFLMERFLNAQVSIKGEAVRKERLIQFVNPELEKCEFTPQFKIASIDIETGAGNRLLYSIAVHLTNRIEDEKKVFIIGDGKNDEVINFFPGEKELLQSFISWFKEKDPDIIIGWHVIGFDLMFLESKCNELYIPFEIARGNGRVSLRARKAGGYFASVYGRVVIDGPQSLRSSFFTFEDYKLETVAQELLREGKTISPDENKVAEIERLFIENKRKLAEYNLNDAVLVTEIFRKSGLIELSVRRSQLSGLLMDQLGMMTAAFDHFLLPRLHRNGYVAPNVKDLEISGHAAGGYVFEPEPGIYNNVIVLDFRSLYPSIIQTFKIDPYSRILSSVDTLETPTGYRFSASQHFLPDFISGLIEQRGKAKKNKDKQLSQAIKILMNSFYGVMGSYGCRFYHPDLPSAITGTGQWLLLRSKEYLEQKGFKVVYGDTDSLFVKLPDTFDNFTPEDGGMLVQELNDYWKQRLKKEYNVNSFLEIEYEKFYRKFIITPARGGESGAKKRYAGLLKTGSEEKIEFVGLEFVRSDWTRLAKEFQVELYERIFYEKEIKNWIKEVVKKINSGEFDDKLVYRKRLRKDVEDYTKNIPQHVRAAKQISQSSGTIYYVITKRGPVPVELKHNDIDYQHYIEKQVKPIADSVLSLLGESFDSIIKTGQLSFFD